jgi:DNA polymerase-1
LNRIVFDVESDGLLDSLTKIHSLVLRDMDTEDLVVSCANQPGYKSIEYGLSLLSEAERIYAHNGIGFDVHALAKVYPSWSYKGELFDTLVAARHRWAHIKETDFALLRKGKMPGNLVGKHSLEAWGCRMGILKGDYGKSADWQFWSQEMQDYCERDTLVTRELILRLRKAGFSEQAMNNEMALAWYLDQQERNGVPFDMDKAITLQGALAAKRQEVSQKLIAHFGSWQAKNGKPFVPKRDNAKLGYVKGVPVQKYKTVEFNPGSRDHIALRLQQDYGWKPEVFTDGGKPKVDESALRGLDYPVIPDLLEYLLVEKRLSQLAEGDEAWLNHTRLHPVTGQLHIHGRMLGTGTVTHRAAHIKPNMGQIPKVGKPWGAECRDLFGVPDGWDMLGTDMSGLELRCLAHYMGRWDGGAYAQIILNGKKEDRTDIHMVTQDALGLPDDPADGRTTKGRDTAKTFFYAYLYGAGDGKLGKILYPALSEDRQRAMGKQARAKFQGGLPALGYLVDALKSKAKKQGYIELIDGRRAYVRHEHAVLNTLLQGTGSVLVKHWVVDTANEFTFQFGPQGWNGAWAGLLYVHDETQHATRPDITEEAQRLVVVCAETLTSTFSFRCPITAEAAVGKTWKETH